MREIVIVTDDRPGVMAEVSEALAAAGVNIETLDAESLAETAVISLTVDDVDAALGALARTRYRAFSEDALMVRLEDRPGELARITRRFKDAGINMRSMRIVRRAGGQSIVAIATDRTREALNLVRDVLLGPQPADCNPPAE